MASAPCSAFLCLQSHGLVLDFWATHTEQNMLRMYQTAMLCRPAQPSFRHGITWLYAAILSAAVGYLARNLVSQLLTNLWDPIMKYTCMPWAYTVLNALGLLLIFAIVSPLCTLYWFHQTQVFVCHLKDGLCSSGTTVLL